MTDVFFQENDTTTGLQMESMDLMDVDSMQTTAHGTLSKMFQYIMLPIINNIILSFLIFRR